MFVCKPLLFISFNLHIYQGGGGGGDETIQAVLAMAWTRQPYATKLLLEQFDSGHPSGRETEATEGGPLREIIRANNRSSKQPQSSSRARWRPLPLASCAEQGNIRICGVYVPVCLFACTPLIANKFYRLILFTERERGGGGRGGICVCVWGGGGGGGWAVAVA